jgi:hypothetical protein
VGAVFAAPGAAIPGGGIRVARSLTMRSFLARGQGLYYLVTGVWPLLSMHSFEAVTGPKVDRWLVKTVGVLVSVIGLTLLLAGRRPRVATEPAVLAGGSAAGLAAIETVYARRGRIAPVYLLDAILEVALVAAWIATALKTSRGAAGSVTDSGPGYRLRRLAGRMTRR